MKNRCYTQILWHLISLSITALFLMPLWWMFSSSLRAPGLLPPQGFEWLPASPTFENYFRIFKILPFGRYIFNSGFVTTSGILLTLVIASWAGFGMSMLGKHARLRLLILAVFLQIIPATAFWLTRFFIFVKPGHLQLMLLLDRSRIDGHQLDLYFAFLLDLPPHRPRHIGIR